jgi:phosphatidylinositol 3-kinase
MIVVVFSLHGTISLNIYGLVQLQEKFRLDLDDEEAVQFFQSLIKDSVSALFPQMVETIHRWAQYWR